MCYESILDSMDVIGTPVFVVDWHPDEVFRYVRHNPAAAEAVGMPNEQLQGKTPHEVMPDHADMLIANYTRCLQTQEQIIFDDWFGFEQGQREIQVTLSPIADANGEYTRIVGAFTDITWVEELHRRYEDSEARFVDSEQRYSSLLNTAPVGIVVHVHGEIYYANEEMAQMLLLDDPILLLGKNVLDYVHPDYREEAANRMNRVRQGEKLTTFEYKLLLPSDKVIDVQVNGTAVHYMGQLAVQTVVKDITEAKRARETEQKLQKERELRAFKSRFVAMVTHDFKNPLASMLLSLNTLENYWDVMDAERRSKKFGSLYNQIDRMNDLLEDVMTISKMESDELIFEPDVTDIERLCRDLFDEISEGQGSRHRCLYQGSNYPIYVHVDNYLMRRAVINLLNNALKYSSTDTTVQMLVRRNTNKQTVMVQVMDEGIGIPEKDLPTLFQPFQRAANVGERQGTGLGLAIVKYVAELHGGHVDCKSQLGVGSTFTLTLPLQWPGRTNA